MRTLVETRWNDFYYHLDETAIAIAPMMTLLLLYSEEVKER